MAGEAPGVAFEVERFESAGGDRLELTGRWSGVRGLRFMRPSLTVQTADGERRLLALLDHKPWAADEGESWIVAFPWDGGPVDPSQAELAVAPHVVVPLATKRKAGRKRATKRSAAAEKEAAERERVQRLEKEVAWLREEREALVAVREQAREELAQFASERDAARADAERLEAESERLQAERERLRAERDRAVEARDEALWERDRASQARDSAVRERDTVIAEKDELYRNSGRDREREARDYQAVVAERDRAVRERDEAVHERDQALKERDDAIASRQTAIAERDAALGRQTGVPVVPAAGPAPGPRFSGRRQAGPAPDAPLAPYLRRRPRVGALLSVYRRGPEGPAWPARLLAVGGLFVVLLLVLLALLGLL